MDRILTIQSLRRDLDRAGAKTVADAIPEGITLAELALLGAYIQHDFTRFSLLETFVGWAHREAACADHGAIFFVFADGSAIRRDIKERDTVIPNLAEWVNTCGETWSDLDAQELEMVGVPRANIAIAEASTCA